MKICNYGCGNEGLYYFKTSDRWCCSKNVAQCPAVKKVNSDWHKTNCFNKNNPFFNKHHTEKSKDIIKNKAIKRMENPEKRKEVKDKIKSLWDDPNSYYHSDEWKENQLKGRPREEDHYLWNGGCADWWAIEMKKIYKECVLCKSSYCLEMHHMDGNRNNNERSNRVILCINCHNFWHRN